jgi:hypothetical protein
MRDQEQTWTALCQQDKLYQTRDFGPTVAQ